MLDLLKPGQREARPGVTVEEEPACLGEELGVGRIPPVDGYADALTGRISLAGLRPLVLRHSPHLPGLRLHVAGPDAELIEQRAHILDRRQSER